MTFTTLKNPQPFDAGMKLGAITATPLRDRVPEVIPVKDVKIKVAFFTGDSLNDFYPDAGADLIEVLTANNVEVHIPKGQSCCGIPVIVHGDIETARALTRNNIDVFEKCGADYLITGCGSCGGAWQHDYKEILASDPVYGPTMRLRWRCSRRSFMKSDNRASATEKLEVFKDFQNSLPSANALA